MKADRDIVLAAFALERTFTEADQPVHVLRGVDLEIARGERVAIEGLSGSGKSTLLHLLGGLDRPDAGEISIEGRRLAALSESEIGSLRNRSLGFVYQFHHLLPEFTAEENVAMPLLIRGQSKARATIEARSLLTDVGLDARLRHKPPMLSGGERQRIALARALVGDPVCVLADEPTGNLDEDTANQVDDLMIRLSRDRGVSFVVVTHNRRRAKRMDRILTLHNGRLANNIRRDGSDGSFDEEPSE